MTLQDGPLLNLRMKTSRTSPLVSKQEHDFTLQRLIVMMTQDDSTYRCSDYLNRRPMESSTYNSVDTSSNPAKDTDLVLVDSLCREKMCEWSYRVIDHFHANREIVAASVCYLDRFMDRVACDRSAFKLAAMTALYMATKIFSDKEISMTSLAELSRGEFDMVHMMEMETIILQTLGWRMNPPTAQCFIHHLFSLFPSKQPQQVIKAIHQRACFFAELAIFDYSFVAIPKFVIGLCAILNSMEGMDSRLLSKNYQDEFLRTVQETLGVTYPKKQLESLRSRLWYLYSQSAQFHQDDVEQRTLSSDGASSTSSDQEQSQKSSMSSTKDEVETSEEHLSPVSVSRPT